MTLTYEQSLHEIPVSGLPIAQKICLNQAIPSLLSSQPRLRDKAPEMNTISNLFKAVRPSKTSEVPSDSSTDNGGLVLPVVSQRPMAVDNIIYMTSEDEEEEYDEDDQASNHEDNIRKEPDDDDAFVDMEKITVKIIPKISARNIRVTPSTMPRRRQNPSSRTVVGLTNLSSDDDPVLEEEPDDDDAFIPIDQLVVKLAPRKPAGKLLKPVKTPAQPKPLSPPQRRRPSPSPALAVTSFDTDDDGELERAPDQASFTPVNQSNVKVAPRTPAAKLLKPASTPAQRKSSSPSQPKISRTRHAKSDSPSKRPSPAKRSQGTTSTTLSSSRARKKLSPPRRDSPWSSSLRSASRGVPKSYDEDGPSKDDFVKYVADRVLKIKHGAPLDQFRNPWHLPETTYAALQRARKLALQVSPPGPGPTSPSSNRDGPTTNSLSGSSGTLVTPPIEEVLFAERVTRSQTARIRKENHRHLGSTPRRAGLTALDYRGRQELPVFQDADGGASRRVVYRPEPARYR